MTLPPWCARFLCSAGFLPRSICKFLSHETSLRHVGAALSTGQALEPFLHSPWRRDNPASAQHLLLRDTGAPCACAREPPMCRCLDGVLGMPGASRVPVPGWRLRRAGSLPCARCVDGVLGVPGASRVPSAWMASSACPGASRVPFPETSIALLFREPRQSPDVWVSSKLPSPCPFAGWPPVAAFSGSGHYRRWPHVQALLRVRLSRAPLHHQPQGVPAPKSLSSPGQCG